MYKLNNLYFANTLTSNCFVIFICCFLMFGSLSSQENIILEEKKLEHYSQDSTQELKLLYNSLIKKADTLGAIITLQEIALTYSHLGSHKDSYDNLWLALLLADASNNDDRKALIYRDIGRHYSYYKRKEKALQN